MKLVSESVNEFGIPLSEDVENRLKQLVVGTISKVKNAARNHDIIIKTDLDALKKDAMRVIELRGYVIEEDMDAAYGVPGFVSKEKRAGFKKKLMEIIEDLIIILKEIKKQEEPSLNIQVIVRPFTQIEVQ